jgi:molecular chaperone GrpE
MSDKKTEPKEAAEAELKQQKGAGSPGDSETEMAETLVLPDTEAGGEFAETLVMNDESLAEEKLCNALETMQAQVEKYQYAVAEAENKVRRVEREAQQARQFAVERFAGDMLAVLDTLELGIQAAENDGASVEDLLAGNKAGLKQFLTAMKASGVESIDPEGEPFNPERHEAMVMQPSDTAEPGSVLMVVQRGYLLNGRLLRPARVIVAKAPE